MPYHIHWFKKNLRFQDNEILIKTYNSSPILLYIIEPEDKIYGIRKMINHKTFAKSVFLKHGSRKSH